MLKLITDIELINDCECCGPDCEPHSDECNPDCGPSECYPVCFP